MRNVHQTEVSANKQKEMSAKAEYRIIRRFCGEEGCGTSAEEVVARLMRAHGTQDNTGLGDFA